MTEHTTILPKRDYSRCHAGVRLEAEFWPELDALCDTDDCVDLSIQFGHVLRNGTSSDGIVNSDGWTGRFFNIVTEVRDASWGRRHVQR